ncbi:exodeoxyribonuclease VII large subunit [Pseudoalteromonas luteoviolacea]|uniref:Exodeoxyribonuclease 7 large subunit n=1 Tax=Pseudoalteromonas luteoviolacea TaxID=43657 RepID=A0A0C1Q3M6_9GAMM|nr:exodeoxyribonuclease VII large subunit [Pseudoalteromonas luteoviolacea]KID55201.1 exodeoxyribonuclease VII large subunit [Pseudoalteromonas luteoviolacea]
MSLPQNNKVYTVSRLNREIRSLLEQGFASLELTGEISNFVAPASGHWYFSLKDEKAQIKAAMWRGNNRYCKYRPENGAQVQVKARVSVYEPRGDYQLIVEQMAPAGEGLLKQQFEALQMQLAAEGLFNSFHKKPLPQQINRIGVVTSATGAAIKDILSVLKRRAPQLEITIYPSLVQGNEAAAQIAEKIALADKRNEVDVLIVGRGGGSLEDLWCFNEEVVARAIFACTLPVISAVGHEIDTTISDYVADLRAPTPSAAAELVSPDSSELISYVKDRKQRLAMALKRTLYDEQQHVVRLQQRLSLQHPQNQLMQQVQRVDELQQRLLRALQYQQQKQHHKVNVLEHALLKFHPEKRLSNAKAKLDRLTSTLHNTMAQHSARQQNQLALLAARLDSVSPLAVLSRGYSITQKNNHVVTSITDVQVGDTLVTQLADGQLHTQIKDIDKLR